MTFFISDIYYFRHFIFDTWKSFLKGSITPYRNIRTTDPTIVYFFCMKIKNRKCLYGFYFYFSVFISLKFSFQIYEIISMSSSKHTIIFFIKILFHGCIISMLSRCIHARKSANKIRNNFTFHPHLYSRTGRRHKN